MQLQIEPLWETLSANITQKRPIPSMLFNMHGQRGRVRKLALTIIANVLQQRRIALLLLVNLHMLQQTIFCVTPLVANLTDKRLFPGMLQHVLV